MYMCARYVGVAYLYVFLRDSNGRDNMIVGFTTDVMSSIRASVQHYVIMLISDLRQVGGFRRVHQ